MAYTITVMDYNGNSTSCECDSSTYILDALEDNGINTNYSCRAGACEDCTCKRVSGIVDQDDQSYYDEEELSGYDYVITCVGYPQSDLTIFVPKFTVNGLDLSDIPVYSGAVSNDEEGEDSFEWDWEFNNDCFSSVVKVGVINGLTAGLTAVRAGAVLYAVPSTIIAAGVASIVEYITNDTCR